MPERITSGCGVYPSYLTTEGYMPEISSTYEGRHITVREDEITTLDPDHAFQQAGHPCMVKENIVGVAFTTCTAGTDYVAIDTEGIWNLEVEAKNPADIAVFEGDELFINKSDAVISKDYNKNTNAHFGYALGNINSGGICIIAVKVHWDPDDAEERVGQSGADNLYSSAVASKRFREYHYEATNGGMPKGEYMALTISGESCVSAQTKRVVLNIPGDEELITGYSTPMELELNISAGNALLRTMGVLQLDFNNDNTVSLNNVAAAYVQLRDGSTAGLEMNRLLSFLDVAALPDGNVNSIITDTEASPVCDIQIRCGYGPPANKFWIMGTTTDPT